VPGRRVIAAAVLGLAAAGSPAGCTLGDGAESDRATHRVDEMPASTSSTTKVAPPPTTTTLVPPDGKTAAERTLALEHTITGELTPKSVEWSGTDRFIAQNMIYSHTIGVYDRAYNRLALVPDTVRLADLGHPEHAGEHLGGPVEAAFSPDGRFAYVSNYEMSGPGFANPGNDDCGPGEWDPSFVYRLDMATLRIDQAIRVGPVPKYVAVTPDSRSVLVTNWCGYDLSVVDVAAGREARRVPLGPFPRGIAVSPDGRTAYVAVMGTRDVAVVDLTTFAVDRIAGVGQGPRHLVLSPDGTTLYVTLNGDGDVAKIDLASRSVVGRVATGSAPRSMDISDDGTALYVVNYDSSTLTKVRTTDMAVVQEVPTNSLPIGITYDEDARRVWVACYSGSLMVFADT
jgi:YVTN family beta-propeller protein